MDAATIDRLIAEAIQRVTYWCNRSAVQHKRALVAKWSKP